MPCPFFEPQALLETGHWSERWTHRPRVPLGEACSGVCHAAAGHEASQQDQQELCNHGYARGRCPHFPADARADAVRLSVISEEPLRLVYILEKDHAPVEHGEIDPCEPVANPVLAAQAQAFVASYRRLSEPVAQRSMPQSSTASSNR